MGQHVEDQPLNCAAAHFGQQTRAQLLSGIFAAALRVHYVRFFVKFSRGFLPPGLQDLLFHCVVLPPVLSVKLTGGCSAPT